MTRTRSGFLTDAQLAAELRRCEYCEEKPCKAACPADCSPADFIMAARGGQASDFRRAAAMIMSANPLGGVCGAVCPDTFCMQACARRTFDRAIPIPAVQATLVEKGKALGLPTFIKPALNGHRVAVVGGGPAGLAAAGVLAQQGYQVVVFEQEAALGGALNLIPEFRLPRRLARTDIAFVKSLGDVQFRRGRRVDQPAALLGTFAAVIVSGGLDLPVALDIPGGSLAIPWQMFLAGAAKTSLAGKRVAVLGGGAVAVDCAATAKRRGAWSVELIYRRRQEDMPLTDYERALLLEHGVDMASCSKPVAIVHKGRRVLGLHLARTRLPEGKSSEPANFVVNPRESPVLRECDVVIAAIGSQSSLAAAPTVRGVFRAGDLVLGAATVVEAAASGKNAAMEADAFIRGAPRPRISRPAKSHVVLPGYPRRPVALDADFFGRPIASPFLLSAAPHTDGYAQMAKAYAAGWSGGIMKTAFDNIPIHIPGGYMFQLSGSTYGNCDNVSGHPLDRVCREVERLVREFPDRLTLASTGGPVTGRDEEDRAGWQANTRKLEAAGAMGVEYSLSCPQGGDGTHGDVVSQNAELTARIIDWVLAASTPGNPKLFKLTAAVTAIQPIMAAIRGVLERYPRHQAGVTLANSFPALAFRKAQGRRWEEGVIVGMSGEGVIPISNLTLARVATDGITVSGNGGPMDYRAAANFLALGAKTVQFCTIVMKYGLGIVEELHSGLSYLMEARGFASVRELIGSAGPSPITDFMALTDRKKIPAVTPSRCEHCGNCTRCPYQAIVLDRRRVPTFDPSRCVGCSLCAQKCFAGALRMRERTGAERRAFREGE